MEEQKINTLVNLGQSKVIEKVYDDLASPPSKKAGQALSTIMDLGNTVLWPIKWVNEKTRIYFENNLRKYEERLAKITDEKIVTVPTEISNPVLDRFTYVSNEELSNAFVKLLASASSIDTISLAHPGFIAVIDRLSSDEAKILAYFKSQNAVPKLTIKYLDRPSPTYFFVAQNASGLEKNLELTFPENISLYLDNLLSLGILKETDYYRNELKEQYTVIENSFEDTFNAFKKEEDTPEQHQKRKSVEKGMYLLTNYGKLFLDACIDE
jgi:hypothetical protein